MRAIACALPSYKHVSRRLALLFKATAKNARYGADAFANTTGRNVPYCTRGSLKQVFDGCTTALGRSAVDATRSFESCEVEDVVGPLGVLLLGRDILGVGVAAH